ncbi:MAG TPA: phage major capsid protein [Pseudoneobacillus sp.]|nr:phage major capsid protein [Pseudoneobacillus sp.]
MKIKALVEKRNALLDELDQIATAVETEVRGLTSDEETRSAAIQAEVESLEKAIKLAEQRSASVEVIEDTKEDRSVEMNLDFEKRAVEQFLRKQDGEEVRAVTAGATPGSLVVPTNLSNLIVEKLFEVASLFSRARSFTPVAGVLEILREQTIGTAGFVGEMTNITANDFTMDKVRLTQKRAGTAIQLSQHIINDSGIDVVNYSVGLLSRRLAQTLDRNVLNGTGDANNQFEGMLTATGANAIGGITSAAVAAIGTDDLIDLYNSLHPDYQAGAVFVMARGTFNTVVKLKDANNQYYLVRDLSAGSAGYRLFGLPVLITDAMPAIATGNKAIMFANMGEAYAVMIKKGLNMQHIFGDTTQALQGSHLLLLDGYFDGKVLNPDAAKFLTIK